jgi:hypothetical protein
VRGGVGGGPPDDGGVLAVAGDAVGEGRANGESWPAKAEPMARAAPARAEPMMRAVPAMV